jgi:hypothetical protein
VSNSVGACANLQIDKLVPNNRLQRTALRCNRIHRAGKAQVWLKRCPPRLRPADRFAFGSQRLTLTFCGLEGRSVHANRSAL